MNENARQGFWNGAPPPIGYRIVEAERRVVRIKKTLAIDSIHADTARLIYRLALSGEGPVGPMGVKAIVSYLNGRRIFTRDGGRWGVGQVYKVLTRTTYVGRHTFNARGEDRTTNSDPEVITVAVPSLIDEQTLDAVQAVLCARNPKTRTMRQIDSPNMLTGLLHCARCGGLMTMRTGKAGRYRYYACQRKVRTDEEQCPGLAVPMEAFDTLIAEHLMARLLNRDRLRTVLGRVLDERRARGEQGHEARLAELQPRADEAQRRLKRLLAAVESGVLDPDDPTLRERMEDLRALQARNQREIDSLRADAHQSGAQTLAPTALQRFATLIEENMRERGRGFGRGYAHAMIRRICVEDQQSMTGLASLRPLVVSA